MVPSIRLPAAQVRRTLGRSQPLNAVPERLGSETQRGITGHIPGIFRVRNNHRVLYCPSPVTAWGMVVACRMARCRSRRGEWSSYAVWARSPVTAWGMIVAYGIARRRTRRGGWASRAVSSVAGSRAIGPVAGSRLVVSLPVSATSMSLPCSRSGEPKTRHLPCPGPTAPLADAASGGLRTFILLCGCGVQ